jgi:hypothetical protein
MRNFSKFFRTCILQYNNPEDTTMRDLEATKILLGLDSSGVFTNAKTKYLEKRLRAKF